MNEKEKEAVGFIKDLISGEEWIDYYPNKEECEKLETILNLIEKLQKQNEKLNNKLLDTLKGQKVIEEETPQYIKENYIPIQKVKDKIEYLEDYIEENSDEQRYWGNINPDVIYRQIEILEEILLKEEKHGK